MLSPATWWNDAFINIPLAYVAASAVAWLWPKAFLAAFIAAYWATNILGSWMLYWAGRELIQPATKPRKQWLMTTLTILYCVVMSILIAKDIVKPIPLPNHDH